MFLSNKKKNLRYNKIFKNNKILILNLEKSHKSLNNKNKNCQDNKIKMLIGLALFNLSLNLNNNFKDLIMFLLNNSPNHSKILKILIHFLLILLQINNFLIIKFKSKLILIALEFNHFNNNNNKKLKITISKMHLKTRNNKQINNNKTRLINNNRNKLNNRR